MVRAREGSTGLTSVTGTAAGWESKTGPATHPPLGSSSPTHGVSPEPRGARPGTSAGRDGEGSAARPAAKEKPPTAAEPKSQSGSQRPRHVKGATDLLPLPRRAPALTAAAPSSSARVTHRPTTGPALPVCPLPLPNLSRTAVRAGSQAQALTSLPSGAATRVRNSQLPPLWVTSLSLPQEWWLRRCF